MNVINTEKRIESINLLKQIHEEYTAVPKATAKLMALNNQLFDQLNNHFPISGATRASTLSDDIINELSHLIRSPSDIKDPALMECHNASFVVMIIRIGLKDYNLPLTKAKGWRQFATNYSKFVLSTE